MTLTSYDSNAMQMVGSFTARINGSDDWAIQSVTGNDVGMGKYMEHTAFDTPLGVYGAAASSLFHDNGGTAPTFSSGQKNYRIDARTGACTLEYSFIIGGSPAGAVDALLNLPIIGIAGTTFSVAGSWSIGADLSRYNILYHRRNNSPEGNGLQFELWKGDGTTGKLQYEEMSSSDVIRVQVTFIL